ncbi:unnamed protein product [Calicophoron daubneyi]|uniref:Reticulocalbin-3 n=1 Tax=Calicophoron daubneyi TaxID=300641 RepID=A0AAV2T9H2_CALDB
MAQNFQACMVILFALCSLSEMSIQARKQESPRKENKAETGRVSQAALKSFVKRMIQHIDQDKNGMISREEMKHWVTYISKISKQRVTNVNWAGLNPQNLATISWKDYLERSFGTASESANGDSELQRTIRNDKRRWKTADRNKDEKLSLQEFSDFLHPEGSPYMRDAVIRETLESADKDKSGTISEDEYINDIAHAYGTKAEKSRKEPKWIERERKQFRTFLDKDKDGKLNFEEVGEWVMPADYDAVKAEIGHLFYYIDTNRNGALTDDEIFGSQDVFVSSMATDYGSAIEYMDEIWTTSDKNKKKKKNGPSKKP